VGKGNKQDEEQVVEVLREQFEEVGRFLGDQLFSLQQSRSQGLITQAARHHAAQVCLVLIILYMFNMFWYTTMFMQTSIISFALLEFSFESCLGGTIVMSLLWNSSSLHVYLQTYVISFMKAFKY
jgi:hypothetical protein